MNKFIMLLILYLTSTIILILSFLAFGIISKDNCLDITFLVQHLIQYLCY